MQRNFMTTPSPSVSSGRCEMFYTTQAGKWRWRSHWTKVTRRTRTSSVWIVVRISKHCSLYAIVSCITRATGPSKTIFFTVLSSRTLHAISKSVCMCSVIVVASRASYWSQWIPLWAIMTTRTDACRTSVASRRLLLVRTIMAEKSCIALAWSWCGVQESTEVARFTWFALLLSG